MAANRVTVGIDSFFQVALENRLNDSAGACAIGPRITTTMDVTTTSSDRCSEGLPSPHSRAVAAIRRGETAMVDPRSDLVLIRKNEHSAWEDKTTSIHSFEKSRDNITVWFARGSQGAPSPPFAYGHKRAAACANGVTVEVPPHHRVFVKGEMWSSETEVVEFEMPDGYRRKVFWGAQGAEESRVYPASEIEVVPDARVHSPQASEVLEYFRGIVEGKDREAKAKTKAKEDVSGEKVRPVRDPIVDPFRSLDFIPPESVLAAYLSASTPIPRNVSDLRVFPFQSNLSQQEAIDQALTHNISIIEGPPGTGKTETILNLIANIVVGDLGSVAVVSLSNAAVENVGEKLEEYGFGHIVAGLGSKAKNSEFFDSEDTRVEAASRFAQHAPVAPDYEHVAELNAHVRKVQATERDRAEKRAQLAEYELEYEHFERHRDRETSIDVERLPLLRRPSSRILEYLAESSLELEYGHQPGLLGRIRKFFRYGRMRDIDPGDVETVLALQSAYYERRIAELQESLGGLDRELRDASLDELLREQQQLSLDAFAAAVASKGSGDEREAYAETVLKESQSFGTFLRNYPVVLSTCHSLRKNRPGDYLFDYLIIDEASQVDLLTATLAMSVCRNLVIVGDRAQLAQISNVPDHTDAAPMPQYDYGEQNILTSARLLYGETVPITLLREHYRCHPAIIGYCNRAFYDGELIPYTNAADRYEPAMRVQATPRGNHMRPHYGSGNWNQRELDVVHKEVVPSAPPGIGPNDIVLAAPYRRQAEKAGEQLSEDIDTADTVHRLQGRQKPMVVLTTVLSETPEGWGNLKFVDDPRLINVAVSRAVDSFVVVTNFDQLPKSRYISDLIGYIEYQYPDEAPEPSKVISVFDLLYRDYDAQLEPLAARLDETAQYRSEEIIRVLLGDILGEQSYRHLRAQSQMLLKSLVPWGTNLTEEQKDFSNRAPSVDFVIFNTISKKPVLVIEVDGAASHENNPDQWWRDEMKDEILRRSGVPLLRLATTDSGEEGRIREALTAAEDRRASEPSPG